MMELKQKLKLKPTRTTLLIATIVLAIVLIALLLVPEGGDLTYLYVGF